MTAQTTSPPLLPGLAPAGDQHAAAWAADRDSRFAAFLAQRMRIAETTSCHGELQALGWILTVLPAWTAARADSLEDPTARACLDTVGWVLRQAAHSRWSRHPEWTPDFHPQAVAPADSMEAGR
ncbi:hypothetical protein ACICHK_00460 [Streptomyces sp. AHU1]|uniref:hypothetical protein n=1 Tax=Streptomyces sp. AHU1 TaxID=3377215 RepID=UPI0038783A99